MGVTPWICLKCGVLQIPPIAERTRDGLKATCTIVHGELAEMCGGAVVRPDDDGGLGRVRPIQLN